jgi:hypothetical protein
MPGNAVGLVAGQGCHTVQAYSKHWPCLFPQHRPGKKHTRKIQLEQWQKSIVFGQAPDAFVRGLIYSDGCRCVNRVTTKGMTYEYVRYFFSNRSADIRTLFQDACGLLGVESRHNNQFSVSVARRYSVAVLDEVVGPKA